MIVLVGACGITFLINGISLEISPSTSSSSQDQQDQHLPQSFIPTQHWAPFKVLRQRYAGMRFEEQRQLHLPQKHKATVADSTLRVEMNGLEEQADNTKARDLFWKPTHGSAPSGPHPPTMSSTQRSGRLLSPRR